VLPHGDERVQAASAKLGKPKVPKPMAIAKMRDVVRRVGPRPDVDKTQPSYACYKLSFVANRIIKGKPVVNGRQSPKYAIELIG
jgi:hypothetical protein